ncbi:MAG: ribbon-helix-helix domain-containing protein [Candidatus Peregrinibacteria bacterium]|nr:ribbon-helix-helix domain-containing protein [Candidatus Peregrinibacteria bacterium]
MKKVIFDISDELSAQIEEVMFRSGFASRTEFFRYLAIEFIQRNLPKKGVGEHAEKEGEDDYIGFGLSPKELERLNQLYHESAA